MEETRVCTICGKELPLTNEYFAWENKERRKPYRGSKAIDPSCRNHGGCLWCEENRKFKFRDKYVEGRDDGYGQNYRKEDTA